MEVGSTAIFVLLIYSRLAMSYKAWRTSNVRKENNRFFGFFLLNI